MAPKHPKLGKLSVTKAQGQSYIQFKDKDGSKKLLVSVTASAADKAGLNHHEMIDAICAACVTNALGKPNALNFRDSFLRDGQPPF